MYDLEFNRPQEMNSFDKFLFLLKPTHCRKCLDITGFKCRRIQKKL